MNLLNSGWRNIALTALLLVVVAAVTESQMPSTASDQEGGAGGDDDSVPHLIRIKSTGYQPALPSAASKEGKDLFSNLNCTACHAIHNVGGTLGPILDGIGARRNSEFIRAKLTNTEEAKKRYAEMTQSGENESEGDRESYFPHVRVSEQTASSLAAFLMTLPEPPGGYVVVGHQAFPSLEPRINKEFTAAKRTASSDEGARLYKDFGCIACHSIDNTGGWMGPKLDGVGGRRSRQFIVAHIANPQGGSGTAGSGKDKDSREPDVVFSQMPKLNATAEQIDKIADFLETLPNPKK